MKLFSRSLLFSRPADPALLRVAIALPVSLLADCSPLIYCLIIHRVTHLPLRASRLPGGQPLPGSLVFIRVFLLSYVVTSPYACPLARGQPPYISCVQLLSFFCFSQVLSLTPPHRFPAYTMPPNSSTLPTSQFHIAMIFDRHGSFLRTLQTDSKALLKPATIHPSLEHHFRVHLDEVEKYLIAMEKLFNRFAEHSYATVQPLPTPPPPPLPPRMVSRPSPTARTMAPPRSSRPSTSNPVRRHHSDAQRHRGCSCKPGIWL